MTAWIIEQNIRFSQTMSHYRLLFSCLGINKNQFYVAQFEMNIQFFYELESVELKTDKGVTIRYFSSKELVQQSREQRYMPISQPMHLPQHLP